MNMKNELHKVSQSRVAQALAADYFSIYVVDPVNDTAGLLRKSLLCTFTTGALNLANFEGMCLGPVLPDGRRTLVLIADSQKGSGGLTNEYVKVILFR